jgi:type III restriction enzyme
MASKKTPPDGGAPQAPGAAPYQQSILLEKLAERVDRWRGFGLPAAVKPYPLTPPRYEPVDDGDNEVSETTKALLSHWFRSEPHDVREGKGTIAFKYWPHQRRLVETIVYLHEVRRVRRVEQLYALAELEVEAQRDPWPKLGGQLATGSGKTKMMSLLVAWAHLNTMLHPGGPLGFGPHQLLIAPGLFVRDRLIQDFAPTDGRPSVFATDPVIPPELRRYWTLRVYSPSTCPLVLEDDNAALVVTNIHQLYQQSDDPNAQIAWGKNLDLLFGPNPTALEGTSTPLLQRLKGSKGMLVINDEAHHVWDEPGHIRYETQKKKQPGEDATTAMAWIRALRHLNGPTGMTSRLALQVDLSATLFEETGKAAAGSGAKVEAKPLFRHTAVRYDLKQAIEDQIVKRPMLERITVTDIETGQPEDAVREGQPNAWLTYRNMLATGIGRWREERDRMRLEGDRRKPILFIICQDKTEAREIANYLTYGTASAEDLTGHEIVGYRDQGSGERLFIDIDAEGNKRPTVVEIHIGQKEQRNEADWAKIRQTINYIDQEQLPAAAGDESGPIANPYNVVVSVLKEGWDVRNVKVIVPLRPCDSRTLAEQTLGRGLRKMHPPEVKEDGSVEAVEERLYVIQHPSFEKILNQLGDILTPLAPLDPPPPRAYRAIVPIVDEQAREARDVRLVRYLGLRRVSTSWVERVQIASLPALSPRLPWAPAVPRSKIDTELRAALLGLQVQEGQSFELSSTPTYRDLKRVLEGAYVTPILKKLGAGQMYKTKVTALVRAYLEKKTFALPAGLPLSFDALPEGEAGLIVLGNLVRGEVLEGVREALLPALSSAMLEDAPIEEAELEERHSSELAEYQALDRNAYEPLARSVFESVATDNQDEVRVAVLLDLAPDVAGWVYNHRQGVGYFIEYEQSARRAKYFPDFVARVRVGEVVHNVVIEAKGRLDDSDKLKAAAGRAHCELLSQHDREPWHYLFLLENKSLKRTDISSWEKKSTHSLSSMLRELEDQPLYGKRPAAAKPEPVVDDAPPDEQFVLYLPVFDRAEIALAAAEGRQPARRGWSRVSTELTLAKSMFLAPVETDELEPGVPRGSMGLFRRFSASPHPAALDGRRLLCALSSHDPSIPPTILLRRLRVASTTDDGKTSAILAADNPRHEAAPVADVAELRILAELLRVVGEAPLPIEEADHFLDRVYSTVGTPRRALQIIFDYMDEAILRDDLARCDDALDRVDLGRLETTTALGFLSITLQARQRLQKREAYAERVEEWLKGKGRPDLENWLKGLR